MSIITKMLDVSTGHMTLRDAETMCDSSVIHYELDEYGWLVYVPNEDDETFAEYAQDRSTAFRDVLLRARELDCAYVHFDRDGPIDGSLKLFDW